MGVGHDEFIRALADRYRVERLLGVGGMASVYLAIDLRHERPVALKVLKPELAEAVGPERFVREMRVTAQLTHPNILPLFDSGEAVGILWYSMPYIEGDSLRTRLLRERQLPVDDALAIARDIADALDYAHSRGILHRDIKPENILLSGTRALVADFGIARILSDVGQDRLTKTGRPVGTALYMSPEQMAGEGHVGPRSDLYALACVVYEMLSGEPPCQGPTMQATLARRLTQIAPAIGRTRPSVPPQVDTALLRALSPIPADRYASGAAFILTLTRSGGAPEVTAVNEPSANAGVLHWGTPTLEALMRRRAVRFTFGYVAIAAAVLQLSSSLGPAFGAPDWFQSAVVIVSIIGLPLIGISIVLMRQLKRRKNADAQVLERLAIRIRELEAERDFYRRLVEGQRE